MNYTGEFVMTEEITVPPVTADDFVNAQMLNDIMDRVVRMEDRCWVWLGAKTQNGQGIMSRGYNSKAYTIYVHRAMYLLAHGPIPPGYDVIHTCGNSSCCNPMHLKAVDPRDTTSTERRKPNNPKLSREAVRMIRTLHAQRVPMVEITKIIQEAFRWPGQYSTVYSVAHGHTYKSVK